MRIEVQDLEQINQDFSEINDPLEHIKVASAMNSEILKFKYRQEHKPQDISVLDYTIMAAFMRHIPYRPTQAEDQQIRYTTVYICPGCKGKFTGKPKYCYHCGQKLEWRDEEAEM